MLDELGSQTMEQVPSRAREAAPLQRIRQRQTLERGESAVNGRQGSGSPISQTRSEAGCLIRLGRPLLCLLQRAPCSPLSGGAAAGGPPRADARKRPRAPGARRPPGPRPPPRQVHPHEPRPHRLRPDGASPCIIPWRFVTNQPFSLCFQCAMACTLTWLRAPAVAAVAMAVIIAAGAVISHNMGDT